MGHRNRGLVQIFGETIPEKKMRGHSRYFLYLIDVIRRKLCFVRV